MMEAPETTTSACVYSAVVDDDPEKLRELINNGASPDEYYEDDSNISSKSILHIACEKGRYDCVRVLIESETYLSVKDTYGQTPLLYCVTVQYHEIARLLLDKDSEIVNDMDVYGKTALHIAISAGLLEFIDLLIEYGANVNARMSDGISPLMIMYATRDTVPSCADVVIEKLVSAGAMLELREYRSKRTAVQYACLVKHVKSVEVLLNSGADPNTYDGAPRTPLTNLIHRHANRVTGDLDVDAMSIVVMLVQSKADLSMDIAEGCNPLMAAVLNRCHNLVMFLLASGSNGNVSFRNGLSPLLVATSQKSSASMRTLLSWNCSMYQRGAIYKRRLNEEFQFDSMELAIDAGYREAVELFVDCGYDLRRLRFLYDESVSVPDTLQDDKPLLLHLTDQGQNPRPLLRIVTHYIRSVMGYNPHQKVPSLPIPKYLKDYLLMKNILEQVSA